MRREGVWQVKCLRGQKDLSSLFLNAWFIIGVGMGGDEVGKSVLGLGRKACEGSGFQILLMAKRKLLADFFFSFTFK